MTKIQTCFFVIASSVLVASYAGQSKSSKKAGKYLEIGQSIVGFSNPVIDEAFASKSNENDKDKDLPKENTREIFGKKFQQVMNRYRPGSFFVNLNTDRLINLLIDDTLTNISSLPLQLIDSLQNQKTSYFILINNLQCKSKQGTRFTQLTMSPQIGAPTDFYNANIKFVCTVFDVSSNKSIFQTKIKMNANDASSGLNLMTDSIEKAIKEVNKYIKDFIIE